MSAAPPPAEVWLLTGDRRGEVAQQRAIGAALGVSVREVNVARLAPAGARAELDLSALRPPWPRLAISFGKTLEAALHLRRLDGGRTRLVHLGRPRHLPVEALDLIVPMPPDDYVEAPNVLRIRMPLNPAPHPAGDSPIVSRLRSSRLPRPWTALFVGGHTVRARMSDRDVADLAARVNEHVRRRGGSLLASTSPRTPASAIAILRAAIDVPVELHDFRVDDARDGRFAAYLQLADEVVVTGDSASMIAECWRSGHPLWVASARGVRRRRWTNALRSAMPRAWIASGRVAAGVDIDRWIAQLARAGHVGLLGLSPPFCPYRQEDDDDLRRCVERIEALIASPASPSIRHDPAAPPAPRASGRRAPTAGRSR